jgi:surfactin synthase thioesterase subunit
MPLTLFCLPCAGASAAMYFRWRRLLPAWIDVAPLELPGRGSCMAQPPIDDFDLLCAHLGRQLAQVRAPYALFGHSMGGLLAYGLAQRLRQDGAPLPQAMFLSACAAPSERSFERCARQDDASLIDDLRRQGGTPAQLFEEPELLRMTLDLLAADYRVCQSFRRPDLPALPLPMRVFGGRDDDIAEHRLRAWQLESTEPLALDWFDGGHFYLRRQEAALLARIASCLGGLTAAACDAACDAA